MSDQAPPKLSPSELWIQADREHHDDPAAARERYRELLREHGHVVPADHPDAGPRDLPCGWPTTTTDPEGGNA